MIFGFQSWTYLHVLFLIFLFRYRISGSALLAAMDQSSVAPPRDLVSSHPDNERSERSPAVVNREMHVNNPDSSHTQANDERFSRVDERTARGHPTIDIAEVLRRWTHALQRIHKQSLQLVCYFLC